MPHHCQGYARPKATILHHHPCPCIRARGQGCPVRAEHGKADPPSLPQGSKLPPCRSTAWLACGRGSGRLVTSNPRHSEGEAGEAPSTATQTRRPLGSCWGVGGGEEAGLSHTPSPIRGWFRPSQHITLPLAHPLRSPSSPLLVPGPSPAGSDWPPQTRSHCRKK